jgi:hypothetical protein
MLDASFGLSAQSQLEIQLFGSDSRSTGSRADGAGL